MGSNPIFTTENTEGAEMKSGSSRSTLSVPLRGLRGLCGEGLRLGSDLVRLADHEEPAIGPGHRASDQQEVVRRVDADDLEVPHRDAGVAMLARLLDPLAGVRRVGRRTRGARMAVHPLHAVSGAEALEA